MRWIKIDFSGVIESGQLTALILKVSGKATLEITLEWGA